VGKTGLELIYAKAERRSRLRAGTSTHWQPNDASRLGRSCLEVTGSFHVIAGGTTGSVRDLCRTGLQVWPLHCHVTVDVGDCAGGC